MDLNELMLQGQQLQIRIQMEHLIKVNEKTSQFGLCLTNVELVELMQSRFLVLRELERIEFGEGILPRLLFEFCDTAYITGDRYKETIETLQEIFYEFKNASEDKVTDDELLTFMREQFEGICYGDTGYLRTLCLERFGDLIKAGYQDYMYSGGHGLTTHISQEERWDKDLYDQILKDLIT